MRKKVGEPARAVRAGAALWDAAGYGTGEEPFLRTCVLVYTYCTFWHFLVRFGTFSTFYYFLAPFYDFFGTFLSIYDTFWHILKYFLTYFGKFWHNFGSF